MGIINTIKQAITNYKLIKSLDKSVTEYIEKEKFYVSMPEGFLAELQIVALLTQQNVKKSALSWVAPNINGQNDNSSWVRPNANTQFKKFCWVFFYG